MKLHCLGTTGFHPSPSRHTACYYLPEIDLVLDAGTGLFRLVQCLLDEPKKSLTILLSHAHLDHIVGLTFLVDVMAVTELEQVTVIGESAKIAAVKEHLYHELLFPVPPSMDFVELASPLGKMTLSKASLEWFPLEHPGSSIGFVLNIDEKKLAYVTDTVSRLEAEHMATIADADLLLHECYFGDQHRKLAEKTGHSWLSAVTEIVEKTRARKTALIHINPLAEILKTPIELDDRHTNELQMLVAKDEMVLEF